VRALGCRSLERGVTPRRASGRDSLFGLESATRCHGNDIGPRARRDLRPGSAGAAARQGLHSASEELRRVKGRAREAARRVRDGGAGDPAPGMEDPSEGGEVTSGTHSPMLDRGHRAMGYVPAGSPRRNELTIDVRGRHPPGKDRREADLQARGVSRGGRELPGGSQVPPRARLGPDRGRHRRARHHLVRAGRARRARPLRAARRRRDAVEGRGLR
jgi:glycine cleavage system aminomethyltransferase T